MDTALLEFLQTICDIRTGIRVTRFGFKMKCPSHLYTHMKYPGASTYLTRSVLPYDYFTFMQLVS